MTTFATKLSLDDHRISCENIYIMCSCDELVLVMDEDRKLLLMNPTTREFKVLPSSPYALDPLVSFTMYGVGYDSVSDGYKVVTLSYYDIDNEHELDCTEMFVNVYSVRNGSWKRAHNSPYDHVVGQVTSGLLLMGVLIG